MYKVRHQTPLCVTAAVIYVYYAAKRYEALNDPLINATLVPSPSVFA